MTGGRADVSPRDWERIWAADAEAYWHVPEPAVVEWANRLPASCRVYDLGCGLGRHTRFLAGAGLRAVGGDVALSGLRAAAVQMRREGLPPALVGHDMAHLPFADDSFDALLAFHVIYHTDTNGLRAILREMRRVLRPGGALYLTFVGRLEERIARYRADVERGVCLEIEPYTFVYTCEAPGDKDIPHHYCDEAEVRQLTSLFEIQALATLREEFAGEHGIHRSLHYHVQAR